MNKYIIGTLILVVGLILVYGIAQTKNKPTNLPISEVSSLISLAKTSYDFGDVDIFGGKVTTDYTLKNEGTKDVSIIAAVTSCSCTEGEIGDLTFGMHGNSGNIVVIPAGGEKVLKAIYDPLAHGPNGVGKIKRELFLKTNSTTTPEIKVTFTANVVKNQTEKTQ